MRKNSCLSLWKYGYGAQKDPSQHVRFGKDAAYIAYDVHIVCIMYIHVYI